MNKNSEFFYDFHLHSCLSPCGDNDMTPNNIINMAKLKGLDMVALTDHNSSKNCKAFMEVAKQVGILAIPGMELCTSEDIHTVCLFSTLEGALGFNEEIEKTAPRIKNNPEIFGEQLIMDCEDNIIGHEDNLLINASAIPVNKVLELSRNFGGTAYPAHADKLSNGIIAVLGAIPPECGFISVELSPRCVGEKKRNFLNSNPSCQNKKYVFSSDAHYLQDISEPVNSLSIPDISINTVISWLDGCFN